MSGAYACSECFIVERKPIAECAEGVILVEGAPKLCIPHAKRGAEKLEALARFIRAEIAKIEGEPARKPIGRVFP